MSNLVNKVTEYFFGTDTIKYYKTQRNFYRDYIKDKKDLGKLIKKSKRVEIADLVLTRTIPNLIDIGVIMYSLATGKPQYDLILYTEGIRIASIEIINRNRKEYKKEKGRHKLVRQKIASLRRTEKGFSPFIEELDESGDNGEGWKKGY